MLNAEHPKYTLKLDEMKNFNVLGLCLLLSLLTSWTYGQKATVKGVVTDANSKEPLPATLRILDTEGKLVTGAGADVLSGEYMISVDAGTYKMTVSYIGLADQAFDLELAAGETKEINVEMKEEDNLMKTVTVTGSKAGTQLAKNTVSIDVVKPTLVDNTNATKVDEVVDKVPGVTVVDGQANIRGGSGYSYGAGSRVLILVDDLPFMSADAGFANWRDIPVENIEQIEVLKGAASALYGSSALNGIINIRTAYAKSKPMTKFSLFQTSFAKPRNRTIPYFLDPDSTVEVTGQAWWAQDSISARLTDDEGATYYDSTFAPQWLAGPRGYRKPIEFGASLAHRRKIGKLDLTLGANGFYKDSYLGGEYERKLRANANVRYRFTDSLNVGANINVNFGNSSSFFLWNNLAFVPLSLQATDSLTHFTYPASVTESVTSRINVDPYLTYFDKKGNRHRLQTRIYYISNDNGNNQSNSSTLYYGEYQFQREFKQLQGLKMVAGLVGQYSAAQSQLYGDAEYDISNYAAYVQLDKGFLTDEFGDSKLNFSFGARIERNAIISPDSVQISVSQPKIENPEPRSVEAKPVFRAGVNYELTPFTFLRASWGQGYRYPTIAERYITTFVGDPNGVGLEIRANPELESETGWSAEIGIKQGFMITSNWKGFVDVSFFWTQYQNMMEFSFGGGDTAAINAIELSGVQNGTTPIFFQSANIGNTSIRGAEFSVMGTGKIAGVDMNLLAGYTFLDPRFQDFDERQQLLSSNDTTNILKYRARHTVKFDAEAFFLKENNLSVGLSVNASSSMLAIDRVFQDLVFSDNDNEIFGPTDAFGIGRYRQHVNSGEYVNLSARIGYRYAFKNAEGEEKWGAKISVVGKNLLNQEYTLRPALVGAPANYTLRLDFDF